MMDAETVASLLGLRPLPVEGGFFRQIWRTGGDSGRPDATAIIAMLTDAPGGFSQFHRLDIDELWHFYGGDAFELVLLEPGGTSRHIHLGPDLAVGHQPVHVVVAGTWMAARTTGRWSLLGNTLTPGFTPDRYDGADRELLLSGWPHEREAIAQLTREGTPTKMPEL
jgi:uncharacterized protein